MFSFPRRLSFLSKCRVLAHLLTLWVGKFFFFQAEDGIRDVAVTGVQTCALPIYLYSYVGNNPLRYVDPFGLRDTVTPWQVGWEWLSGIGPRVHNFTQGDPLTEMLKQHSHIQELRQRSAQNCSNATGQRFDYTLSGLEGIPKYVQDYSTLATAGQAGNLVTTYLGSYLLSYDTVRLSGRKVQLTVNVSNTSTLESALRPPILGYTAWWQQNVGPIVNGLASSGPMSRTELRLAVERTAAAVAHVGDRRARAAALVHVALRRSAPLSRSTMSSGRRARG